MDSRELNIPKKTVQRDGWSDVETDFFVERYNSLKDEVGKNKRFKTKIKLFDWIAGEMAMRINSSKTGSQLSGRFYTLTRKPKQVASIGVEPTTESWTDGTSEFIVLDSSVIDLNGTSIITLNESSTPAFNNSSNKTSAGSINEAHVDLASSDTVNEAELIDMSEGSSGDVNNTSTVDMITSNLADLSETSEVNNEVNESVMVVGSNKSANTDKTAGFGLLSSFNRNYSSLPRFNEPSRALYSSNVGIATVYNTSGSSNITPISGTSGYNRPIMRISGAASLGTSSSGIATSCADASSLTRIQSSTSSPSINVSSSSNIQTMLSPAVPSSSRNSNTVQCVVADNSTDNWTENETKWLLDQYYCYMDDVGPMKIYRTKKDMWDKLAAVMNVVFELERTGEQLSKQVQKIISQKKNAVDRNRKSGGTRVNVPYEEEINRIAQSDDSIEPEVLRDANSVYYKESSKSKRQAQSKKPQSQSKKPRWDKPNKKAILNTLSETMLSIEQRRAEREKSKEERRKQMHEEAMELLLSLQRSAK